MSYLCFLLLLEIARKIEAITARTYDLIWGTIIVLTLMASAAALLFGVVWLFS